MPKKSQLLLPVLTPGALSTSVCIVPTDFAFCLDTCPAGDDRSSSGSRAARRKRSVARGEIDWPGAPVES
jgi:hypothetical protein